MSRRKDSANNIQSRRTKTPTALIIHSAARSIVAFRLSSKNRPQRYRSYGSAPFSGEGNGVVGGGYLNIQYLTKRQTRSGHYHRRKSSKTSPGTPSRSVVALSEDGSLGEGDKRPREDRS